MLCCAYGLPYFVVLGRPLRAMLHVWVDLLCSQDRSFVLWAREGDLVLLGLHAGPLVPWVSIGPWSLALGVPLAPWCPPVPCPWPLAWALVLAFRRCWCLFYGLAQGVQCTCCV